MAFFPNTELVVIPDAGHEMFAENTVDSIAVVREFMNNYLEDVCPIVIR